MRTRTVASPTVAGLIAAAVALGAGELVSGLVGGAPSLVLSVGQWVIERAPPALEDAAISVLGQSDKAGLVIAMVIVALAGGALTGRLGARHFGGAAALFVAGGAAGVAAALAQGSGAPAVTVLAGLAAVVSGIVALRVCLRWPEPAAGAEAGAEGDAGRRTMLRGLVLGSAGAIIVGGGAGRLVARLLAPGTSPDDVMLAAPAVSLPPPAAGTAFDGVAGLTPLFTPNGRFYRIDTALVLPRVDLDGWQLRVTGMVDRPFSLSYTELAAMPQVESDVTLCCVSNEVGGGLVGNARWQGVPLAALLERAGVRPGADQIVGRSVDGWTGGFPTEVAFDGRPALVALGMNGHALPVRHGFPARLVVPGLYGYVSATKWLREIELTTFDAYDAYWVPRGWSQQGPIKLASRIDVPRYGAELRAGRQVLAGVAWAPTAGVERVEVSVDGGRWEPATLAGELSTNTWRQWRHEWDATPGRHRIAVRATAAGGEVQTDERRRPRPSGATGHHTVQVQVQVA